MSKKIDSADFFENGYEFISGKIILFLLVSTIILYVIVAFSLLGYYADAAYYLFKSIMLHSFFLEEPSSLTVQIIQQTPLVLAQYIGIENIYMLSVIFGMTLLMAPLALLVLTYLILPSTKKIFFFFPLLHFLIGTQASLFPVVTEAPLTAGYFWVLFYFILFYPKSTLKLPLLLIFSLPAITLHDSMVFLSPILAIAAIWSFRKEKNYMYILLALWYLIIAAVQFDFILNPRSTSNRSGFLAQLLELKWIYWDGYNTSTVLGIIFISLLTVNIGFGVVKKNRDNNIISWKMIFLFGILSFFVVLYSFSDIDFYGVITQFAARANSTLLSFPLALLTLLALKYIKHIKVWANKTNTILLAILWIGILSSHTAGIYQWSTYIKSFKSILANHNGIIPYWEISKSLTSKEQRIFKKMSWSWTHPTMSFLLSENKEVSSILKNSSDNDWQPFDPCDAEELFNIKVFDTKPIINILSSTC